jgi:uncharacterized RDD family membrane protein YckC
MGFLYGERRRLLFWCVYGNSGKEKRMDLQKASMWKRISAWIFDVILMASLAVGIAYLLSLAVGYDSHNHSLDEGIRRYEAQYGITFEISPQAYEAMNPEEKENYDAAYAALVADEQVLYVYNMVAHLSLLITTAGILISMLLLEFIVPLLFGNGQTLGKKMFSIGLMRTDGVRVPALQLFIRTLLGKFTVETMIPVYIVLMFVFGSMDITGSVVILALLMGQILMLALTHNNSAIHDKLAGTVVVDTSSQKIFRSSQELLDYTKKIHAEQARRQTY